MKPENKSLRIGAFAVIGALALRLISGHLPNKIIGFFSRSETMSTILFLETGIPMRPYTAESTETSEPPVEPTEPVISLTADKPCFTAQDKQLVSVNNSSSKKPDTAQLLQAPLDWDLTGTEPTVLILHTHASESYADCSENYRSLEADENLLIIGQAVANSLTAAGITVIHDTAIHDYPSYNGSYSHARKSTQQYLKDYPSIRLVLDIHRDAMEDKNGNQIATTLSIDGQKSAQLMMVVGTNGGGLTHPNWQENFSLAAKLHAQLERLYPGICRPISLRNQRFNEDLSPGAMLIEVGAAGNTQAEALLAAQCLSTALISLSQGTT